MKHSWIYRYRELGPAGELKFKQELTAIRERKFWFSTINSFNDPFEFMLISDLERFGWQGSLFGGRQLELSNWTEGLLQYGVCCFSLPQGTGPDNQLMWAHYADCHRGLAIGMQIQNFKYQDGSPVVYSPSPHAWDDSAIPNGKTELERVNATLDQMTKIIFRKPHDWTAEREYRLVMHQKTKLCPQFTGEPWPIETIHFGARMTGEMKRAVRDSLGDGFDYFDTILSASSYQMSFQHSKFQNENDNLITVVHERDSGT